MSPSLIAMGVAGIAIIVVISSIAGLSLFIGAFDFFFGKPKLTILKSVKGPSGFAFGFEWNDGKEPIKIDRIKVRLFNPFGSPTQVDCSQDFAAKSSSFALDVDFGAAYETLIKARGFENATIQVEVYSSKDGVAFQFDMKASEYKSKLLNADRTAEQFNKKFITVENPNLAKFGVVPQKSMIADTVPGKGPQLKLATNPQFAGEFNAAAGTAAAATGGAPVDNFSIAKVWIEPGCIVCNACENIFPEVFEVLADTCIIRPGAPLNDGLKVKEAAEACPVEVIKFTKAS